MFQFKKIIIFSFLLLVINITFAQRKKIIFNSNWQFTLNADSASVFNNTITNWQNIFLPHDWSKALPFSKTAPATTQGGALPGGIGWYKKIVTLPKNSNNKIIEIEFDGVYRNSELWVNGNYIGKRPNGYVNFAYKIHQYLNAYPNSNEIIVKCDNSQQPNSRWYSGSGIYRDVYLNLYSYPSFRDEKIFLTTPIINRDFAIIQLSPEKHFSKHSIHTLKIIVKDDNNKTVSSYINKKFIDASVSPLQIKIPKPKLWDTETPHLYSLKMELLNHKGKLIDNYQTTFGIRSIRFSADSGFFINNKHTLLKGVCMHHDLGALGAAYNRSAARRQLEILKDMGCNAIRFSHNPPAADMLSLCDEMGFLVIDEAFDMWAKKKNKHDYHKDFKEWWKEDLKAMIQRDRNHPSIISWSIGNEIREQFDSSGMHIAKQLADVCNFYDGTRPVLSALTETHFNKNFITQSKALDVLGFNYKDYMYDSLPIEFPNIPIIATETASALSTRRVYKTNPDSINIWPPNYKVQDSFTNGLADFTCPAYDNTFAYWGNTHEASWNAVKKHKNIAGAFVWSGFDYLGEPVPYPWPARSSYFGIIDLAGFPKDVYYMYKSEWSNDKVLHVFPHWNHNQGDTINVWSYYNQADEVEAFVNGKSFGKRKKEGDVLHVSWKIPYTPGALKVVSYNNDKVNGQTMHRTSGKPAKIKLELHKPLSSSEEYAFVTATVLDKNGLEVPTANNEITFTANNGAKIIATDNGLQTDTTIFTSNTRKMFNGKLLAIVKLNNKKNNYILTANAKKLITAKMILKTEK